MRPTLWLCLSTLASCTDATFPGLDRQVAFAEEGQLSRSRVAWSPARPVAVGSTIALSARHTVQCSGAPICSPGAVSVRALPFDGGGVIATTDAGPNFWEGVALAPGIGVVPFGGSHGDRVSLTIGAPVSLTATDPVLYYRPFYPEFLTFDGGAWPDIEGSIELDPGTELFVALVLRDASGNEISFSQQLLEGTVTPPFAVRLADHGLTLLAPDAGGQVGTLSLKYAPTGLAREVTVLTTPADEAPSSLQLFVENYPQTPPVYVAVKAAVALADGGVWWQAPIEWSVDGGVVELGPDGGGAGLLPPMRRDTRVYRVSGRVPADGGAAPITTVTARLGGLSATASVELPPEETAAPPPTTIRSPLGGCGCSSAPELWAALALAKVLLRRRSARRST